MKLISSYKQVEMCQNRVSLSETLEQEHIRPHAQSKHNEFYMMTFGHFLCSLLPVFHFWADGNIQTRIIMILVMNDSENYHAQDNFFPLFFFSFTQLFVPSILKDSLFSNQSVSDYRHNFHHCLIGIAVAVDVGKRKSLKKI